ncbi:ABC transporter substrate-binding protein [Candidatus Bipolaricaulota bacterium]|nr:ABC transporter substrate-binding protein [Candidatus Bipolaricaulota bacterium]
MNRKLILRLSLVVLVVSLMLVPGTVMAADGDDPVTALMIPAGSLTPGFLNSNTGGNIASSVYDYLFRINDEGDTVLSLAKSYEINEDSTVWTIELHEGVTFHDGSKLTSEDVVYTIERLMDPDVGSALLGTYGSLIDSVEAVDEYTVRFNLARADAGLDKKLTDYNAAIISSDYNYSELGDTQPMGSGAYRVDNVVPRERVVCSGNEDYWVEGSPKIDALTFLMIPEKETAVRMLSSGQGDIISDLSPDQYLRLQSNENVNVLNEQYAAPVMIDLNTDEEPFNDKKVRRALAYTVDRESLLQSAGFGLGTIGNDTVIPPWHEFYDDLGGIRERDIEKAKQLLEEAGYSDGVDVTLYCGSNIPPVLDVVLTVQEMARPAGFNIELHTLPRDMYYAKYWLQVPMSATLWGHREDITQMLGTSLTCDASWNASHYCNEELDKYVELASGTKDPDKRQEYFTRIQEILHEDVPALITMFKDYLGATSTRIEGFYLTQNWINDYRFIELKD